MALGLMGRFFGYRYGPMRAISAKTTMITAETARAGVLTNSRQRLAAPGRDRRRPCWSCWGVSAEVVVTRRYLLRIRGSMNG
jgi:hypothetical protein